jgi:light-harvesting complex I chlorophyll a/b binding protein 1
MSFRAIVLFAVIASTLAFAPLSTRASRTSISMAMTDLPGITSPLGFFDPLGLSKNADSKEINRLREAELKHGRVCMLAFVGILVGEAVEFSTPLYGDKIVGPAIYQFQEADQLTGFGFAFFIVGLISVIEGLGVQRNWADGKVRADITPGDLNWDPLSLKPSDPAKLAALQTKEINNGRLAMIGVAGMIVQELVNGKGILENAGFEGALPKAFDTGIL